MSSTSPRCDGWKEIASHLKRSVRCVQRWERREQLPIRRHRHTQGASVYAFCHDLDAWWQNELSVAAGAAGHETICSLQETPTLSTRGVPVKPAGIA